jgi:serine/threonine protein kinase
MNAAVRFKLNVAGRLPSREPSRGRQFTTPTLTGRSDYSRHNGVYEEKSPFGGRPARIIVSPLPLAPGARLGVYEVTAQIGEGGMGQVFRARDTKLDRDIAIKILPAAFAHDVDRLARFQREAKTLASLNHPNIAIIHGLEQAGDVHALVMEFVNGEDLSQRIARGAIPLDEALPIAKQIADALEAAHEQGIIHRDLKPANIVDFVTLERGLVAVVPNAHREPARLRGVAAPDRGTSCA